MIWLKITGAVLTVITIAIGVRGDTWHKKRRRPTRTGWATIIVGACAFVVGATEILVSDRLAESEKRQAVSDAERRQHDIISRISDTNRSLSATNASISHANEALHAEVSGLSRRLIHASLYSNGFSSVAIQLAHPQRSATLEKYQFTFQFLGKGTPWGVHASRQDLFMFANLSNIDDILSSTMLPFSLRDYRGHGEIDPDKYLQPTNYVSTDETTYYYRATADDVDFRDSSVAVYLGPADIAGIERVALTVTSRDLHETGKVGDTVQLGRISISLNGHSELLLNDTPGEFRFGGPDTYLGYPYVFMAAKVPKDWQK